MKFTQKEILGILEKIGYSIVVERESSSSRKSRLFQSTVYLVEKDGEKMDYEEAFKKELINRIFKI